MSMPQHFWIIERNPLEVGVILAAYGDEPGYCIQDHAGAIRRPTKEELRWATERFGPAPEKSVPTLGGQSQSKNLLRKAAAARPYGERTSSANARTYGY